MEAQKSPATTAVEQSPAASNMMTYS